ncbi:MAG TPA: hypothetical protein VF517_16325 [Thermoleophilaceae bacterium]
MLEHKGLPYRCVDIVPLTHPFVARLHGFDAGSQKRTAGDRRSVAIRFGDRLGTVPGLAAGDERISTNHAIARFLEDRHPEPPLFPDDPARREAVEEVERWGNDEFQMAARRIGLAWAAREPAQASRSVADGRMGPVLYRHQLTRRLMIPLIGRLVFNAGPGLVEELLAGLPQMLDRIDAWIADGVLGGEQLNAADFMVAPSLALILYRPDVMHLFEGRPALELVDRLLPEPA